MFNETNLAKELSDILEIDNYSQLISSNDVIDYLSTIQYHMDEPQSNPSVVPLFFLAKMASEHVTVVLSGEGADEIFGGYLWYQKSEKQKKYELLPQKLRRGISNICKDLPTNQLTNFLVKGGQSVEEKYIGEAIVFPPEISEKILKEPYKKSEEVSAITNEYYKDVTDKTDLTKMQYLDMHLWLPRDILLKADKMSMAHSIELRVPFLDREVMNLAKKVPANYKVNSKGTKLVLREAAREDLPEEWAKRKKLGFPVPIRYWLREEQYYKRVKSLFSSEMAAQFFETNELLAFLQEHYDEVADRGRYIWTVLTFLLWYEEFFVVRK